MEGMTIKLLRVELSNIRSHEHVIFTPADTGITAISGVNGAGKSTIVDSVAWVLFGSKPQNVGKISAIIRHGVVPGKNTPVFAQVEIMVDGLTYRVNRKFVSKAGASECNVWVAEEADKDADESTGVTWRHEAGPAASHADVFIRRFLHMDEKGFLSAILVQQKQVDALISAGAKDRAGVIEKLTGISVITASLEEARKQANEQKRALALFSVDDDELKKLKSERNKLSEQVSEHRSKLDSITPEWEAAKTASVQLSEQLAAAEGDIARTQEWERELLSQQARRDLLSESLTTVLEEKSGLRAKLTENGPGVGVSLADAEAELSAARTRVSRAESDQALATEGIETARSSRRSADELVASSKVKTLEEATQKKAHHEEIIAALLDAVSTARSTISSNQAGIAKLDKAVSVLVDGDGTCPTCLQHVDEVSAAVSVLNDQKSQLANDSAAQRTIIDESTAKGATQREIVRRYGLLISALEAIRDTDAVIEAHQRRVDEAASSLKSFNHAVKSAQRKWERAREHDSIRTAYEDALAKAQAHSDGIDAATGRIDALNAKIKASGALSTRALTSLRTKANTALEKHHRLTEELGAAQNEVNLSSANLSHVEANIARAEAEASRYEQARSSYEKSLNTVNLLTEFREDRIEKSVGGLEVYASDLLSRFTDGKFTRLSIDTKFNTTVVLADGTERAVGLLSGGELSAAAMALRLAVSILLNGGSHQNLMILDEVLVSQDATRAELILSAVKEVFKGQVVIIAHNDSINAVADHVFSMAKTPSVEE